MQRVLVTILLLVVAAASLQDINAAPARPASRGATVALKAKWDSTSTLLEAAEFLADEGPQHYWSFVESWAARGSGEPVASCWGDILTAARAHTSAALGSLLPLVLASRKYSPRLELFATLAAERAPDKAACCWVDVNGRVSTTSDELHALLAAGNGDTAAAGARPTLYDVDHVYNGTAGAVPPADADIVAVLYGALGTRCFAEMHAKLVAAAAAPSGRRVAYVHRPYLAPSCGGADKGNDACVLLGAGGPLQLPGYGVEMAIKNMEYSALDDSKAKQEAEEAEAEAVSGGEAAEVEGFIFSRLIERNADSRAELLTFREALLASANQEQTLKVWDLKDLGLQAAQRILGGADPLALLTEVAQNFPALAGPLSRLEPTRELRAELAANRRLMQAGGSLMLLNGQTVDLPTEADLFSILDNVRQEVRLAGRLADTRLAPEDISALMMLRGGSASEAEARVDLTAGSSHISWVNDLERDAAYRRWPKSLRELLQPLFPGQVHAIGRNLFNLVAAVDLASPGGLGLAVTLTDLLDERHPIRAGILPVLPAASGDAAGGKWAQRGVSAQAAEVLEAIRASLGGRAASAFLARLAFSVLPSTLDGKQDEQPPVPLLTSAQVMEELCVSETA